MSKKETEFDRYDRMKKIERENGLLKRKEGLLFDDGGDMPNGKLKAAVSAKRSRSKNNGNASDEEFAGFY